MTEQTELFIENVRRYKCLYDSSDEMYKNIVIKAEAWTEIAEEFNMTIDAAKAKWKNLRDSYLRYKKSMNGEEGQARKYSKWPWSRHMTFLDDPLDYYTPSSYITQRTTEIEDEQSVSPARKKKRKSHSEISDVDKGISYPQLQKLDGVDHLFKSYAATFKTFRPKTQAKLKLQLASLFAETELEELQAQEVQTAIS